MSVGNFVFKDQMSRTVNIDRPINRIISLVPSQTELLFDLGLESKIAGVTKFCTHPARATNSKSIVGGTKNFRFEVIDDLNPDLIIGNKEENYEEGICRLEQSHPVWMSDISNLNDSLKMIGAIGQIMGVEHSANRITDGITHAFNNQRFERVLSAIYLIWQNPFMVAGKNTFINEMMIKCGFKNLIDDNRYPELNIHQIQKLKPEYILLSSEPYPFNQSHQEHLSALFPTSKVILVDGEMFSWYGSRLLKAPKYFSLLRQQIGQP